MKMNRKDKFPRRDFFTLIEVVVVIVILVMLASIAAPLYFRHIKTAKISTAKTQIKLLEQALNDYKLDVGSYPSSADGLQALLENVAQHEKWDGPYIKPNVPKDPWGNEYVYVYPADDNDFHISSYGADGTEGGEGENADINSWE